jgi:MFS family permease
MSNTKDIVDKKNISLKYRLVGYFTNANDYPSFHIPILLFYAKAELGLSFTTTILVFYGLNFISSIIEIPAGSFGDKYGRKVSYLLGVLLMAFGFGLWLFNLPLIFYIIGTLTLGVGGAFRSGSMSSMIYEEYAIEDCSKKYHIFQSRSIAMFYGTRLFAMPLGAYLYTVNHRIPLILTVAMLLFCGGVALLIQDKNISPIEHNARSLFKLTINKIRHSNEIRTICLFTFLVGVYGNIIWRLFQPGFSELNIDIKYIGYFYSLFSIAGVIGSLKLGKIIAKKQLFVVILLIFVVLLCTYLAAYQFFNIYTLSASVIAASLFFPVCESSIISYLQHKFERYQQATIMSIVSFLFWFGLTIGDVIAGISNNFLSITNTFLMLVIFGAVLIAFVAPLTLKNIKIED